MCDRKLPFASDYMEGAHPKIIKRLQETNLESTSGYGTDRYCASAKEKIRAACGCPEAEIYFLVGGTQTNATVIDAILRPYQGVIASAAGHVSLHEAGAIERGGHKVLTLPHRDGKIAADVLKKWLTDFYEDDNHEHMVNPGMVYISQPTEYGTLYTKEELSKLREVCDAYGLPLYLDGARMAYGLACPENDVSLKDLARLCDVFYIGGTKCGALFGEALVIPRPGLIPHFFTIIKQHGALLAKGRLLGLQFDTLFTDGLYYEIGTAAIRAADRIRAVLKAGGFSQAFASPTNQIFPILTNGQMERLAERVEFSFWEKCDESRTITRFATCWATTEEDTEALCALLLREKNEKEI